MNGTLDPICESNELGDNPTKRVYMEIQNIVLFKFEVEFGK